MITRHKFSKHSDVWSFGITCWEVFSFGLKPFWEVDDLNVKVFIVNGGKLLQPENCPSNIWTVITQCWNKQPHTRPAFDKLLESLMKSGDLQSSSTSLNVVYE